MFTTRTEEAMLQRLVAQTQDSARAYRDASRDRTMLTHRDILSRRADERDAISAMLSERMREMGSQPPQGGTLTGALSRSWAFFKNAASRTDEALLDEIAEGERTLRHEFEAALDQEMHAATRRVVLESRAVMANGVTMPAVAEALQAA